MVQSRWKRFLAVPLVTLHCLNFFSADFALALSETGHDDVDYSRELVGLAQKWNLTDNGVEFSAMNFNLGYITSDFIIDNMVTATAYSSECKGGGVLIPQDDLAVTIIPDDTEAGAGDLERDFSVRVDVNTANVGISSVYDVIDDQARVEFCMRFSLYTRGTNIEVNFLETIVKFTADLSSGFSIEQVNVEPKNILEATAFQNYEVDAYQCDANNERLSTEELANAMNQGEVIRVCVTPTDTAQQEGVYMRAIESFTYSRDYGGPTGLVTQVAVENSQSASNYLTVLDCVPGSLVCTFDTVLFASMFLSPGFVDGSGSAVMQFGTSSSRQLEAESSHRSLQKGKEGSITTTEFDLDFELVPGEEFNGVLKTSSSSKIKAILSFVTIGTIAILNLI
mmetsp:Transcript_16776/g.41924  ORF Transcript_16776/g.41924 Transcript_16776/m.41924 type:complete len:395 (+) Transcript_16776:431-1615(+)